MDQCHLFTFETLDSVTKTPVFLFITVRVIHIVVLGVVLHSLLNCSLTVTVVPLMIALHIGGHWHYDIRLFHPISEKILSSCCQTILYQIRDNTDIYVDPDVGLAKIGFIQYSVLKFPFQICLCSCPCLCACPCSLSCSCSRSCCVRTKWMWMDVDMGMDMTWQRHSHGHRHWHGHGHTKQKWIWTFKDSNVGYQIWV